MLSNRLRPDVECAPWVIEEVKKMEQALDVALDALECIESPLYVREITKVGEAMKLLKEVSSD